VTHLDGFFFQAKYPRVPILKQKYGAVVGEKFTNTYMHKQINK
jgi:hypothetical protein